MTFNSDVIEMAHGGGGKLSQELIHQLFIPAFGPADEVLHDAAVLNNPGQRLAFTTDSYVVRPLFFPGGDIGKLSVYGSINDLAMTGARAHALSVGLIIEEGLPISTLEKVVHSIRQAADQSGVKVVTGDTKVVEKGKGDGLFINTSAIGVLEHNQHIHPSAVKPGDAVLVSGDLGRHGVAILIARNELGFRSHLESDLESLQSTVQELLETGVELHCLRDLTRGGLASAIDEIARGASCGVELEEETIPLCDSVRNTCSLLGLEPLSMANEGRMVVICPENDADQALAILQNHHVEACRIGKIEKAAEASRNRLHPVSLKNSLGVRRPLDIQRGDYLPRIC